MTEILVATGRRGVGNDRLANDRLANDLSETSIHMIHGEYWNATVRGGHLGGKQNNDKMLNPLIPFTMSQEKVNFTHDPANVLKFSSHRTIC